ncbi:helix-turn-helix transcriptional regulator [Rhodococcus tibetensis]|uniref:WYL domain-containing protein n=1 Tax=Rhodococcus tibetensis TaxID=2965064 RepID=A0ABT1QLA3_9NOCA|nr:WYL domain-containing protein [Rhodococcus sp. FXJ9.536]MCQ4122443.1 WYL domain-containing protein [Rhodococcus sp. FXJ9.536]
MSDPVPADEHLGLIQQAVFVGRRLNILYASRGAEAVWRIIDPLGLIYASGRWYLVATDAGRERTYRLERIEAVVELDESAQRPADVDLAAVWERRRTAFRATTKPVVADVLVRVDRRDDLVERVFGVRTETAFDRSRVRVEAVFGDHAHANGVLWAMGDDVEVLGPAKLRAELLSRAMRMLARYE